MVGLNFVSIGVIVILIGFILIFAGTLFQERSKTKVEGGGIVFIGPIPIIGATSEKSLYIVLALSIIFLFMFMLINFLGR